MADLSETEMAERLRRLEEEIYGQSPDKATEIDGLKQTVRIPTLERLLEPI